MSDMDMEQRIPRARVPSSWEILGGNHVLWWLPEADAIEYMFRGDKKAFGSARRQSQLESKGIIKRPFHVETANSRGPSNRMHYLQLPTGFDLEDTQHIPFTLRDQKELVAAIDAMWPEIEDSSGGCKITPMSTGLKRLKDAFQNVYGQHARTQALVPDTAKDAELMVNDLKNVRGLYEPPARSTGLSPDRKKLKQAAADCDGKEAERTEITPPEPQPQSQPSVEDPREGLLAQASPDSASNAAGDLGLQSPPRKMPRAARDQTSSALTDSSIVPGHPGLSAPGHSDIPARPLGERDTPLPRPLGGRSTSTAATAMGSKKLLKKMPVRRTLARGGAVESGTLVSEGDPKADVVSHFTRAIWWMVY